jgi:hypothetical protein
MTLAVVAHRDDELRRLDSKHALAVSGRIDAARHRTTSGRPSRSQCPGAGAAQLDRGRRHIAAEGDGPPWERRLRGTCGHKAFARAIA